MHFFYTLQRCRLVCVAALFLITGGVAMAKGLALDNERVFDDFFKKFTAKKINNAWRLTDITVFQ